LTFLFRFVSRQNEKTININVQQNLYAMPCGTLHIAKRWHSFK
jgi:hypothetical protein